MRRRRRLGQRFVCRHTTSSQEKRNDGERDWTLKQSLAVHFSLLAGHNLIRGIRRPG
jgi:hypothetical protein